MASRASRLIISALGVVWLLQGIDVLHGSSMTGHHQYTVLGAVAIVLGAALLVWAERARRQGKHPGLIASRSLGRGPLPARCRAATSTRRRAITPSHRRTVAPSW